MSEPEKQTTDTILSDLFDDPKPEKKVEVVEPVEVEEKETPEVTEDEYETPIGKKTVEKEPEEEEELEKLPPSKAVERAKVEGKRRKELEAKLKEKDIEYDRVSAELETHKSRLSELETIKIKPNEHPDFISLRDEIIKDVRDEIDNFDAPHKKVIFDKLGDFIGAYRTADNHEDRDAQIVALKDNLAENMFGEDSTFESLDKDDRKEVSAALRLLKKSTAKADRLGEIHNDLSNKVQSGTLAVGVKEYEKNIGELKPILDAIGDLSDEIIDANPYAIESKVALLAKLPEGKKRLENAKRDVIELVSGGPRPLTQSEIEKLEANGTNIKTFQADRQKAHKAKILKLIPMLVHGLVTRSAFKEMSEEMSKFKKKKSSEETEDDALRKIRSKKPTPEAEVVKKKTSQEIADSLYD